MSRVLGKNPNHWNTRFYEFAGQRRTISQWATHFGLSYSCIQSRLRYGIPLDRPKSPRGRPVKRTDGVTEAIAANQVSK